MNDSTRSNKEHGYAPNQSYADKLKLLQETPFSEQLQDKEHTRLIMCETNLFCRDKLKKKGRKIDDVPTYGEYFAYLRSSIVQKKDADTAYIPSDQTGFFHSKLIESSLNLLAKKSGDEQVANDTSLASKLSRPSKAHFDYVKHAIKERLEMEEKQLDLVKDYGRQPRDHVPTDPEGLRKLGAQEYERLQKANSDARQKQVLRLKARGLSLYEIDFILNGRKRTPLHEEPRLRAIAGDLPDNHVFTDFVADITERDTQGYNPVTKPADSDHLDQHRGTIERLRGHLDVLTTIQSRYDSLFNDGRSGGGELG